MNKALHLLMKNETVDSTQNINITDLDPPPLITFCPRQKVNTQKLDEFGYADPSGDDILSLINILGGNQSHCLSKLQN